MTYILYGSVHLHILEKNWCTVKNPKFIITYSEYEYESANRAKYVIHILVESVFEPCRWLNWFSGSDDVKVLNPS